MSSYHQALPSSPTALLDLRIPRLERKTAPYVEITYSGDSTVAQEAPKLFLPLNIAALLSRLASPDIRAVLAHPVDSMMVEESHEITVEADVQRAVSLYLLHGVNQILRQYLQTRQPGKHFVCACHVGEQEVLALELKTWGALRDADWLSAVAVGNTPDEIQSAINEKEDSAARNEGNTATVKNAMKILKQVTKSPSPRTFCLQINLQEQLLR
ncbi:hypothetical protein GGX14DRAFT_647827 [Mycena pura]|uniref:Uncharacterized protein n=1 Tax=Mycena pura TaxID=153505 RepID=A0AAD6V6Q3_9AGAR|nr:hypothetical protein GGX14DRAFT_647827 [Mycena pura]